MRISRNGTPNIKKEISSDYGHYRGSLSSYRGSPFVTGGDLGSGLMNSASHRADRKTELLNLTTMQWERKADFPKRFVLTS